MSEEQTKPAATTSHSYFETAAFSLVIPIASLGFGWVLLPAFSTGVVVVLEILSLMFGFGLSIYSIIGGFRRAAVGAAVLGMIAFAVNGCCLLYGTAMWLYLSNLHC